MFLDLLDACPGRLLFMIGMIPNAISTDQFLMLYTIEFNYSVIMSITIDGRAQVFIQKLQNVFVNSFLLRHFEYFTTVIERTFDLILLRLDQSLETILAALVMTW